MSGLWSFGTTAADDTRIQAVVAGALAPEGQLRQELQGAADRAVLRTGAHGDDDDDSGDEVNAGVAALTGRLRAMFLDDSDIASPAVTDVGADVDVDAHPTRQCLDMDLDTSRLAITHTPTVDDSLLLQSRAADDGGVDSPVAAMRALLLGSPAAVPTAGPTRREGALVVSGMRDVDAELGGSPVGALRSLLKAAEPEPAAMDDVGLVMASLHAAVEDAGALAARCVDPDHAVAMPPAGGGELYDPRLYPALFQVQVAAEAAAPPAVLPPPVLPAAYDIDTLDLRTVAAGRSASGGGRQKPAASTRTITNTRADGGRDSPEPALVDAGHASPTGARADTAMNTTDAVDAGAATTANSSPEEGLARVCEVLFGRHGAAGANAVPPPTTSEVERAGQGKTAVGGDATPPPHPGASPTGSIEGSCRRQPRPLPVCAPVVAGRSAAAAAAAAPSQMQTPVGAAATGGGSPQPPRSTPRPLDQMGLRACLEEARAVCGGGHPSPPPPQQQQEGDHHDPPLVDDAARPVWPPADADQRTTILAALKNAAVDLRASLRSDASGPAGPGDVRVAANSDPPAGGGGAGGGPAAAVQQPHDHHPTVDPDHQWELPEVWGPAAGVSHGADTAPGAADDDVDAVNYTSAPRPSLATPDFDSAVDPSCGGGRAVPCDGTTAAGAAPGPGAGAPVAAPALAGADYDWGMPTAWMAAPMDPHAAPGHAAPLGDGGVGAAVEEPLAQVTAAAPTPTVVGGMTMPIHRDPMGVFDEVPAGAADATLRGAGHDHTDGDGGVPAGVPEHAGCRASGREGPSRKGSAVGDDGRGVAEGVRRRCRSSSGTAPAIHEDPAPASVAGAATPVGAPQHSLTKPRRTALTTLNPNHGNATQYGTMVHDAPLQLDARRDAVLGRAASAAKGHIAAFGGLQNLKTKPLVKRRGSKVNEAPGSSMMGMGVARSLDFDAAVRKQAVRGTGEGAVRTRRSSVESRVAAADIGGDNGGMGAAAKGAVGVAAGAKGALSCRRLDVVRRRGVCGASADATNGAPAAAAPPPKSILTVPRGDSGAAAAVAVKKSVDFNMVWDVREPSVTPSEGRSAISTPATGGSMPSPSPTTTTTDPAPTSRIDRVLQIMRLRGEIPAAASSLPLEDDGAASPPPPPSPVDSPVHARRSHYPQHGLFAAGAPMSVSPASTSTPRTEAPVAYVARAYTASSSSLGGGGGFGNGSHRPLDFVDTSPRVEDDSPLSDLTPLTAARARIEREKDELRARQAAVLKLLEQRERDVASPPAAAPPATVDKRCDADGRGGGAGGWGVADQDTPAREEERGHIQRERDQLRARQAAVYRALEELEELVEGGGDGKDEGQADEHGVADEDDVSLTPAAISPPPLVDLAHSAIPNDDATPPARVGLVLMPREQLQPDTRALVSPTDAPAHSTVATSVAATPPVPVDDTPARERVCIQREREALRARQAAIERALIEGPGVDVTPPQSPSARAPPRAEQTPPPAASPPSALASAGTPCRGRIKRRKAAAVPCPVPTKQPTPVHDDVTPPVRVRCGADATPSTTSSGGISDSMPSSRSSKRAGVCVGSCPPSSLSSSTALSVSPATTATMSLTPSSGDPAVGFAELQARRREERREARAALQRRASEARQQRLVEEHDRLTQKDDERVTAHHRFLDAQREAYRREQLMKAERERARAERKQRQAAKAAAADAHYRRQQLRYRGLRPWQRLCAARRTQHMTAAAHADTALARRALRGMVAATQQWGRVHFIARVFRMVALCRWVRACFVRGMLRRWRGVVAARRMQMLQAAARDRRRTAAEVWAHWRGRCTRRAAERCMRDNAIADALHAKFTERRQRQRLLGWRAAVEERQLARQRQQFRMRMLSAVQGYMPGVGARESRGPTHA